MKRMTGLAIFFSAIVVVCAAFSAGNCSAQEAGAPLPGTEPLVLEGDPAKQMVAGIDRYLTHLIEASGEKRAGHWRRDFSSPEAYVRSVAPNRERLRAIIGAGDARCAVTMEAINTVGHSAVIARGKGYQVTVVRWPVLGEGIPCVYGEGLLIEPDSPPIASVIALPDCDWTPEMVAGLALSDDAPPFALHLAERGCRVLVPSLLNRDCTYSGNPDIRMTNQPHREFIYRAAFELGHHVIGYEVQKVMAGVDWLVQTDDTPVGVFGYGEGGLVALYAGALDTRIESVGVSGYFRPRERVWSEPIYRNVFGLLEQFGDAELASLVTPRTLVVEAAPHPEVDGPPEIKGRAGAAPGAISTPSFEEVYREVERARALVASLSPAPIITLIRSDDAPCHQLALGAFLEGLGVSGEARAPDPPKLIGNLPSGDERTRRQFLEMVEYNERLLRDAAKRRAEFWSKADASSLETWQESTGWYREYFHDKVIGRLPEPSMPANPRTRQVFDTWDYRGYQVMLDVYPDVFAYGILLAPKGIAEGEERPVVVCQHGLEGWPEKVASPEEEHKAYKQYGCRLAEMGYVVYAPQNPYIGGDAFRVLQRKANPLKLSLFSVIVPQHARTVEWLGSLPFADASRIGFYGLSYGGKTAMRVPALVDGYCLSICSGDFNEWIWKNASSRHRYSYLFTGEYEMFEFDLGNTFNYAEMSALILPRPFMVERGHFDGVAPDEWVGYEYARTRRYYDLLGVGDRTEIEFFNGPHAINGVGTFAFLAKHLGWPNRAE